MNILQVTHDFLPEIVGGVEIYTYELSRQLSKNKHRVSIFTRDYRKEFKEDYKDKTYKNINVRAINTPPKLNFFKTFRNKHLDEIFTEYLDELKPDIVHFQHLVNLSGNLPKISKRKNIPSVMTLHDYWMLCHQIQFLKPDLSICSGSRSGFECSSCFVNSKPFKDIYKKSRNLIPYWYRNLYQKGVLKDIDLFIHPSLFMKKRFAGIIPEQKLIHIPYGINFENITGGKSRSINSVIKFAFIGTIKKHKGIHVLLEAARKIDKQKFEIEIFGKVGSDNKDLIDLNDKAVKDKIKFMGKFENENLADILSTIDVLIIPSIWEETGPLVMLEAFAAKIPVIASNLGGMSEWIKDGENSLLFNSGNAEDLANKMNMILLNPHLIDHLREKIPQVMSIQENSEKVEKLYKSLLV